MYSVDDSLGTVFQRQLKQLRKRYPRIERDLAQAYRQIGKDPRNACMATAVPRLGLVVEVFKYRVPNSDANRGRSGGYRIYAVLSEEKRLVVPIVLYSKSDHADIAPSHVIECAKAAWSAATEPEPEAGQAGE